MKFDYTILSMFINLFGGISKVAACSKLDLSSLNESLAGKRPFEMDEMDDLATVLSIPDYCINAAFFTRTTD
ncbi:hypothetical protein UYO_3087 [Lachnospiraceae bacterium JC7]|nr:hypothetical protein UYO_3087 [Lachnospiraceae bacterium JC7]